MPGPAGFPASPSPAANSGRARRRPAPPAPPPDTGEPARLRPGRAPRTPPCTAAAERQVRGWERGARGGAAGPGPGSAPRGSAPQRVGAGAVRGTPGPERYGKRRAGTGTQGRRGMRGARRGAGPGCPGRSCDARAAFPDSPRGSGAMLGAEQPRVSLGSGTPRAPLLRRRAGAPREVRGARGHRAGVSGGRTATPEAVECAWGRRFRGAGIRRVRSAGAPRVLPRAAAPPRCRPERGAPPLAERSRGAHGQGGLQ